MKKDECLSEKDFFDWLVDPGLIISEENLERHEKFLDHIDECFKCSKRYSKWVAVYYENLEIEDSLESKDDY